MMNARRGLSVVAFLALGVARARSALTARYEIHAGTSEDKDVSKLVEKLLSGVAPRS